MNDFTLNRTSNAVDSLALMDSRSRSAGVKQRTNDVRPVTTTAHVLTKEQVKAVVEQIDSYLRAANRELQFQVDEESGEVIVRVRDPATGEVIRQIPGEEAVRVARALQVKAPALLDLVV